ncbi:DNA gyrase inhibitor YacG [Ketobacter sp.]|nr:MAG: DNA gyrase inhibitor YacG [Ketobacter sp.]
MEVKCPTCEKMLEWSEKNPFRPFCSERCKLIDLGEWASGERYIAGSPDWSLQQDDSGEDPSLH